MQSMHGAASTLVGLAQTLPKDKEHASGRGGRGSGSLDGGTHPVVCRDVCRLQMCPLQHLLLFLQLAALFCNVAAELNCCLAGTSAVAVEQLQQHDPLPFYWKTLFACQMSLPPSRMHEQIRSVLLDLTSVDNRCAFGLGHICCQ